MCYAYIKKPSEAQQPATEQDLTVSRETVEPTMAPAAEQKVEATERAFGGFLKRIQHLTRTRKETEPTG